MLLAVVAVAGGGAEDSLEELVGVKCSSAQPSGAGATCSKLSSAVSSGIDDGGCTAPFCPPRLLLPGAPNPDDDDDEEEEEALAAAAPPPPCKDGSVSPSTGGSEADTMKRASAVLYMPAASSLTS